MSDQAIVQAGPALSEWYFFAVFVFLLAALLIWFYKRTPRSQKKREEKSFEREAKLFKLYQNIEDLMDGFEEYVEELQSSFRLESGEIKRRVEALETQHAAIRHALREISANISDPAEPFFGLPDYYEEPQEPYLEQAEPYSEPPEPYDAAALPQNGMPAEMDAERMSGPGGNDGIQRRPIDSSLPLNRAQKVRILLDEGLSAVRIAKELGLSLNEVSLIIQLDERTDASLD